MNDVLAEFEPLISAAEATDADERAADSSHSPWVRSGQELRYHPNHQLLIQLLTGPLASGASTQSGRLAKAFDAWVSYELRRAQFDAAEVWPRNTAPRVASRESAAVAQRVERLVKWMAERDQEADVAALRREHDGDPEAVAAAQSRLTRAESRVAGLNRRRQAAHAKKLAKASVAGKPAPAPPEMLTAPARVPAEATLPTGLREAVRGVVSVLPNINATNILGRFYVKQVDVVVSSWDRGPDVLISGKTMFSSFANNTNNRYEETLGEASNLRDRYPLAAMGYAFLVSDAVLSETGVFARLQDLLQRTRKPYGPYDATMLLLATWDAASGQLQVTDPLTYPDEAVSSQQPPVDLSASRFFTDLLNTVIANTPVGIHEEVRSLRNGTPAPGGTPDLATDADEGTD